MCVQIVLYKRRRVSEAASWIDVALRCLGSIGSAYASDVYFNAGVRTCNRCRLSRMKFVRA